MGKAERRRRRSDNIFALNQLIKFARSSFILLYRVFMLLHEAKIVVSSLNIAKTNYLLFPSSKLVNVGGNMKLYAGADEIIRNECCTFLGIIIDDKLGWLDHINSINNKLSRSLYILNSVKNMLPNYILRQLYFTMVQPYLTYGIILWGSTYQSYLKRTVILQKKAIRYMHTHSLIWRPSRVADTPPLLPISRYGHRLFVADVCLCSEVLQPGGSWSSSGSGSM